MRWFQSKEEPIQKKKGIVFHQEIQDTSIAAQKIKEELFRKNLEERVEKNLKLIRKHFIRNF